VSANEERRWTFQLSSDYKCEMPVAEETGVGGARISALDPLRKFHLPLFG
jgi:hypothetical protein